MAGTLFWLYLVNAVLLINHEIDSAYWKEWDLFKLPGGITGFLILHLPLVFLIFLGLLFILKNVFIGLIFSLIISFSGIFAFIIHIYFIRKGNPEFKTPVSIIILTSIFILSIFQIVFTFYLLIP